MIGYHPWRRNRGRNRNEVHVPRKDIAFAMELRTEGISWKWIGVGIGYSADQIKGAVFRATS